MSKNIVTPIKPESDTNEYRVFTLENDIQVIAVSDPDADMCVASLVVGVGSLAEPDECLGLAHFLEHMLFLGTEKYPDEREYCATVSKHGGYVNAWTACDHTNYFFNVAPEKYEDVLDRFSQFFISPLFTESATEREMNAVHSEHQKNIHNNAWRQQEMQRLAMNPDHPYSKFHTGNLDTLKNDADAKGIKVRDILLDFHAKYYSSNLMKLCLYGNQSLDELEKYAIKYFSGIKNLNIERPMFETTPEDLVVNPATVYEHAPIGDVKKLKVTWVIPKNTEPVTNRYELLTSFIGDEGKGSILAYLKQNNWATGLGCGTEAFTSHTQFSVSIALTAEGLDHVADILHSISSYITMLANTDDAKLQVSIDQLMELSVIKFKFSQKPDPLDVVSDYTTNLFVYPPENVITGDKIYQGVTAKDIKAVLPYLSMKTVNVQVIAPEVEQSNRVFGSFTKREVEKEWEVEPYYKIKYYSYRLSVTDLAKLNKPINNKNAFALPPVNPFIPKDFTIYTDPHDTSNIPEYPGIPSQMPYKGEAGLYPSFYSIKNHYPLLSKSYADVLGDDEPPVFEDKFDSLHVGPQSIMVPLPPGPWVPLRPTFEGFSVVPKSEPVELWYKLDQVFNRPQALINTLILSPLAYATPRVAALTSLFINVAKDVLGTELYPATEAGTTYTISASTNGIVVHTFGYSDVVANVHMTILTRLRTLARSITPEMFQRQLDALIRSSLTSLKDSAYSQVSYATNYTLTTPMFHLHERLAVYSGLEYADLVNFIQPFFSQIAYRILCQGNITIPQAVRFAQSAVNITSTTTPSMNELTFQRKVIIPYGNHVVMFPQGNPDDKENAVKNTYQIVGRLNTRQLDYKLVALAQFFALLISQDAYDTLRTSEQLGYIVFASFNLHNNIPSIDFLVQGSDSAIYLDARIESYIANELKTFLDDLSEEELEEHKASKIVSYLEKDNTLLDEANRHWKKILNHCYDFDRILKIVEETRSITKQDLLDLYNTYLVATAPERRKMNISVCDRDVEFPTIGTTEYVYPAPKEERITTVPPQIPHTHILTDNIMQFKLGTSTSGGI